MIYFNINIRNPRWWNRFDSIWTKHGKTPFKHKYWEVQFMKNAELFRIEFEWTVCQDHAGVRLELALFGYQLNLGFHDSRHWDIYKNQWHDYSKEATE
jgi:hypothetical protein